MPGDTLPNMSLILPSLGGDIGTWDDSLNALIRLVDPHDHTDGKGARVPTAGLDINANLAFNAFEITALGKVAFTAITTPVSGSKNLFVDSNDNELYWRTNGGTNVKLTSGTTLNMSLVGGIVGDYTSVGAEVAYDDANDRYTFKQQTTFPWARIACGSIQIYEFNTTESVAVSLLCPAALAGSFSITLPIALPGSTVLMQMSSTGVITLSNTVADAFVCSSTVTATGFKHTTAMVLSIPACMAQDHNASHVKTTSRTAGVFFGYWALTASGNRLTFPIQLPVGSRITGYTLYVNKLTDNTNTLSARLWSLIGFGATIGTGTALGAGSTDAGNSTGDDLMTETGLSVDIATGLAYVLAVQPGTGVAPSADEICHLEVSYTRP